MKEFFHSIAHAFSVSLILRRCDNALPHASDAEKRVLQRIAAESSIDEMRAIAFDAAGNQEQAAEVRLSKLQRERAYESTNRNFDVVDEMAGLA